MLKIGILGIGENTLSKLQLLKELSFFELTGIFDPYPEKAIDLAINAQIIIHENFQSLLDVSDAIYVDDLFFGYFELISEAIKKSKHIYIEKPTSLSAEESNILRKLAEEAQLKIQVSYPDRFNPALIAARNYFHNPMFIETHRLSVYNENNANKSVVAELMVNDIDILLSMIKSNVKKISASGVAIISNSYDIANARIEFDNGCVANITASRISLSNMCKSRFFQNDSYITVDMLNNCTSVIKINENCNNNSVSNSVKIGNKEVYFQKPDIIMTNVFKQELISFYNCIASDTRPHVSIEDSFKTLQTAEIVLQKMKLTSNCI